MPLFFIAERKDQRPRARGPLERLVRPFNAHAIILHGLVASYSFIYLLSHCLIRAAAMRGPSLASTFAHIGCMAVPSRPLLPMPARNRQLREASMCTLTSLCKYCYLYRGQLPLDIRPLWATAQPQNPSSQDPVLFCTRLRHCTGQCSRATRRLFLHSGLWGRCF